MKPRTKQERRKAPRYLAQIQARCFHVLSDGTAERTSAKVTGLWKDVSKEAHNKGVIRDISVGGVYLASQRAFLDGTILVIELVLPKKQEKVVVIGLVRWTKSIKGRSTFRVGLGIQFIYMQKQHWAVLQRFLKGPKPSALAP